MTRYSRSAIPGRPVEDETAKLDSMVFGAKKKPAPRAANDEDDPDFLPPVEDDEADLLVSRSSPERRRGADRRNPGQDRRRAEQGRRGSDYRPLRNEASGYRGEDGKRGPLLLVGALLIVIVFGVVVWNAYSDGLKGEADATAPELAQSGAFKTPSPELLNPVTPSDEVEVEVLDALDGGPAAAEVRPAPALPPPAAVQPAPLKPPVTVAPAVVTPKPVAPAVAPPSASAPISLPKPVAPAVTPAVKPAPAPATPPAAGAPAFAAGGGWVAQVASTASEASAISEWDRYSKSHPDLFAAAERSIQTADVNGQTRYRLRVGSFATKADANAFCAAFKARGGNCLPATK